MQTTTIGIDENNGLLKAETTNTVILSETSPDEEIIAFLRCSPEASLVYNNCEQVSTSQEALRLVCSFVRQIAKSSKKAK